MATVGYMDSPVESQEPVKTVAQARARARRAAILATQGRLKAALDKIVELEAVIEGLKVSKVADTTLGPSADELAQRLTMIAPVLQAGIAAVASGEVSENGVARAHGEWNVSTTTRLRRDAASHAFQVPVKSIKVMCRAQLNNLRRGRRVQPHRKLPAQQGPGEGCPTHWVRCDRGGRRSSVPRRGAVFNLAERVRGSCGAVQQTQATLTGPRFFQAEEDLVEEPVPGRGLSTPLARAQCEDDLVSSITYSTPGSEDAVDRALDVAQAVHTLSAMESSTALPSSLQDADVSPGYEDLKDEEQDLVQGAGDEELHSELFCICCNCSLAMILGFCFYIWWNSYMQFDHFNLNGIMTLSLALILVFGCYFGFEDLYLQGIITSLRLVNDLTDWSSSLGGDSTCSSTTSTCSSTATSLASCAG